MMAVERYHKLAYYASVVDITNVFTLNIYGYMYQHGVYKLFNDNASIRNLWLIYDTTVLKAHS